MTHTGPDAGHIEELRPGRYWLGCLGPDPNAGPEGTAILISDPALSRIHARLEVNAKGVQIFDRDSSNGLWMDGRRVSHARLSTTSLVRAGNTLFRLHIPGSDTGTSDGSLESTGTGSAPQPVDSPVEVDGTPPQRPGTGTLQQHFCRSGSGSRSLYQPGCGSSWPSRALARSLPVEDS
ncbi:FHA domain-containing protein [Arthrobacter luteolus]|uniref:FHA domain-containing protein n=1 Tax=Arthrobacter luteolus TaxID=98672 RepID=UPI00384CA200